MAENVVTKGATTADPMQKTPDYVPGHGQIEDLGGPSPDNYKPDDDSAKLKTPSAVVAKPPGKPGAKADPMPKAPDYAPGKGGADSYSTGSGKAKTKVEETEVEGDVVEEEKIDSTGDMQQQFLKLLLKQKLTNLQSLSKSSMQKQLLKKSLSSKQN